MPYKENDYNSEKWLKAFEKLKTLGFIQTDKKHIFFYSRYYINIDEFDVSAHNPDLIIDAAILCVFNAGKEAKLKELREVLKL